MMKITAIRFQMLSILAALILASGLSAAEPPRKYKPLKWKWSTQELKDISQNLLPSVVTDNKKHSLETENWKVVTWFSPKFTAQAGQYLEMFTEVFTKAFLLKEGFYYKKIKPTVYFYPSLKIYRKKTGAPEWSGGLFSYTPPKPGKNGTMSKPELKLHIPYTGSKKQPKFDGEIPLGTIQHEGTHCLLRRIYGPVNIPMWLNEGAAGFYEAWDMRARITDEGNSSSDIRARADRRKYSPQIFYMRDFIDKKHGALPRLDTLMTRISNEQFYSDNGGIETAGNYAKAESFIDFMMNYRGNRRFFLNVLERTLEYCKDPRDDFEFITADEALKYEVEWLEFLQKRWGVSYKQSKIRIRVAELKRRAKER